MRTWLAISKRAMKNRAYIIPPDNCMGCGLCANLCSQNAIEMVWSQNGFLEPEVDIAKCVGCGICSKLCIAKHRLALDTGMSDVISYAAWSKDKGMQRMSSSGGVFSSIAEMIISSGGVVYGVKWQDKCTAAFTKVTKLSELMSIRGSKYVQAHPGYVYREVHSSLKEGKRVLFAGTACQVHALKSYLRKDYDDLVCLEILCHGVPSRLLMERYVAEHESSTGKIVDKINFRDKTEGWEQYRITCHYTDGTAESESLGESNYMGLFLSDLALNEGCYSCPFAGWPRQGDLTLGDYWGIPKQEFATEVCKDGVGSLIVNSEQGRKLLHEICEKQLVETKRQPFARIFRGQPRTFVRTGRMHGKVRRKLLAELHSSTLHDCMRRYGDWYRWWIFGINRRGIVYRLIKSLRDKINSLKRG